MTISTAKRCNMKGMKWAQPINKEQNAKPRTKANKSIHVYTLKTCLAKAKLKQSLRKYEYGLI